MATIDKRARLSIDLGDPALVKAIRHVAVEQERPVRAIVVEALQEWLKKQEDLEDLAAIDATESEPDIPWEQVKAEIRAAEAKGE